MRVFLMIVGIFILGMNSAYADDSTRYRVSITNLTKGQLMTPIESRLHCSLWERKHRRV